MQEYFDQADKECWEAPEKYALTKERINKKDYYSIFCTEPVLSMKLCDDFDYALRLSKKMIECGVRVFEDFKSLMEWYNKRKATE